MSLFKDSIKYGFVVCPAINKIRSQKRTLLYDPTDHQIAYTFASMMMEYGYIPSKEMFNDLMCMDRLDISQIFNNLKATLDEITSNSDIQCSRIFYENFPDVPFNLFEQRLLAIAHYYSYGTFFPSDVKLTSKEKRTIDIDEKFQYKELSFASYINVIDFVFEKLLPSKNSLPMDDLEYIKSVIAYMEEHEVGKIFASIFDEIVNKEILAVFVSSIYKSFNNIEKFIIDNGKFHVTDVLRIATAMCNGDVSLAENTKFKFNKSDRKFICNLLLSTNLSFEDALVHKNKWVKLLHCLHVGEHSSKLHKWAMVVRENIKVDTFNSFTEKMFKDLEQYGDVNSLNALVYHLSKKPSLLIRNISRIFASISLDNDDLSVLFNEIKKAIMNESVPNRILYQLYSYLSTKDIEHRVFFPKGMKTKFWTEKDKFVFPHVLDHYSNEIQRYILESLHNRFSKLEPLGKVYVNPLLSKASLNNGLRNVTPGKKIVSRGCKVPFDSVNTLRMFMFWIGRDLDLAASFLDKKFRKIGECSFRETVNNFSQHSGDIVYAPSPGASEYIDIDINKALSFGVRYIGMHIFVYRGQTFNELEKCCVGWMNRSKPRSNEPYDPRTVSQYIDLTGNSMTYTPVVFDLKEKTVCFVDMNGKVESGYGYCLGKQGYDQMALFKSIVKKRSLSLGTLIDLHCSARNATIVDTPEEADIVFDLDKGITPYDYLELEKWV